MEDKTLSLRVRIVGISLIFLIGLSIILSVLAILNNKKIGEKMLGDKAKSIVSTISPHIDTEKFLNLNKTLNENDPYYKELYSLLNKIKKENKLTYLYTFLLTDADEIIYIVDGDENPETKVPLGEKATLQTEAIKNIKTTGIYQSKLYEDKDFGHLITGFSAIRDSQGNIIGGIGADVSDSILDKVVIDFTKRLIIYSLIIIVLISLGAVIFGTHLARVLEKFLWNFDNLSQGNLLVELNEKRNDEIGKMGKEINGFLGKLKLLITDIKDSAGKVDTENTALLHSIDNVVKGENSQFYKDDHIKNGIVQLEEYVDRVLSNVQSQASATEQSLSALEEITATTKMIKDFTNNINTTSKDTLKYAENGNKHVLEMSDGMGKIKKSVAISAEKVESLGKLSSSINGILNVIRGIAEQTNLLALNASIEAARSGESGRGFTVVSDEIKKLAEKTNQETVKIAEIINSISGEVNLVRQSTAEVDANVDAGLALTEVVKKDLRNILKDVSENEFQISEIVTSTEEQLIASVEITKAANDITDKSSDIESLGRETHIIASEISAILQKKLDGIGHLAETARELKNELEFFKVI